MNAQQSLEVLKRLSHELPWAIRMLTESATPEALDRKEFARRLRNSEEALLYAIRAIEARDRIREALRDLLDAIPEDILDADPPLRAWVEIAEDELMKAGSDVPTQG